LDGEEDAATREGEINEETRIREVRNGNADRSRKQTEDGTGNLKTTKRKLNSGGCFVVLLGWDRERKCECVGGEREKEKITR